MEEELSTVSTLSSETLKVNYPNKFNHAKDARVSRLKGVRKQKNGHWDAEIYSNGYIWLGSFRSETEAAMAYDSASIKLRKLDPHRNFPWNPMTIQEPNFQNQFSTAAVLNMIKDHSYPLKFTEFLRKNPESGNYKHGMTSCTELFRKELTPSDVGALNRLVIPKKFALRHFPSTSEDALFLKIFDRSNKLWQFRYCYWNSSQSFVFTKGWNKFVKEKDLKVNDEVIFYICEPLRASQDIVTYYMIDVARNNRLKNNGLIQEEVETDIKKENGETENKEDPEEDKIILELGQRGVESKGIKLFGVQIVPHTAP